MRHSLYWDNFNQRIEETVQAISEERDIPVRRVAVFITDRCNLKCKYCNTRQQKNSMTKELFSQILDKYPRATIHITGGEPSVVNWLYPHLQEYRNNYNFHLNTNLVAPAPYNYVKRLKVSLDSHNELTWNKLVGKNVFKKVVKNIKEASEKTVTSITCTVTRQNMESLPEFSKFCSQEFPELYAVFFSVYKGKDEEFRLSEEEADQFFFNILPRVKENLNEESRNLVSETLDEKRRLIQGVRFPENNSTPCYISLSERVYDWNGESCCSHLYRDGIRNKPGEKHPACEYGCNRRLVMFNQEVYKRLCKEF